MSMNQNNAAIQGGYQGAVENFNVPRNVPTETLTDILTQNLIGLAELNGRLRESRRKLRGVIPEPVAPNQTKQAGDPSALDLAFSMRQAINESHELIGSIQNAL